MLSLGAPQESFQKALRSLETGCDGWSLPRKWKRMDHQQLVYNLRVPNPERVLVIKQVRISGAGSLHLHHSLNRPEQQGLQGWGHASWGATQFGGATAT